MSVARHMLLHARKIGGGGSAIVILPLGSIALWSRTLATIPANWALCDGTGGTPNLVARFVRGAPAATNPGTTGGADSHGHASMTSTGGHTHAFSGGGHSHVVNSAGSHSHGWTGEESGSGGISANTADNGGSHQHTTSTDAHTHTVDNQGTHTHAINTGAGRPPYYEVAFIQAGAGAAVAANLIILWTGTLVSIPAGWALCDGGGGRPELRSRFIRGVNTNVTNPGTTGGATTHLHIEVAAAAHTHTSTSTTHSHTHSAYTWTHSHCAGFEGGADNTGTYCTNYTGAHTHAATNALANHNHNAMGASAVHDAAHIVDPASSLPAYYDVAYIINTGGAVIIPVSGINFPLRIHKIYADALRPRPFALDPAADLEILGDLIVRIDDIHLRNSSVISVGEAGRLKMPTAFCAEVSAAA